ncbi:SH3 domain-containing protein [Thermosynechococcaceae cyanobacterium BACA0444]|uniref:SH3 domain-containing protein n=2 Tax=Pseudocalidococcus TaxID=3110321 RepID=A0AAE4FQ81_9CYAN|nr:SH3 domain-containing protein [Pseudocalidococcus azoricus BACA0444]
MWSKTLGTILGLGIILFLLAGGYYLLVMPLTGSPPRPEFENEFPITGPPPKPKPTPVASPPVPQSTPTPSPTSTVAAPESNGTVIEPIGLSVRSGPSRAEVTLGGVALNETVTILEASSDGKFYRVKTSGGLEGWVIAAGVQANSPIPSPSPESPSPNINSNSQ